METTLSFRCQVGEYDENSHQSEHDDGTEKGNAQVNVETAANYSDYCNDTTDAKCILHRWHSFDCLL